MAALLVVSGYTSINAVVKAELFPAGVRALGVGLPYAVAASVFGGTAPLVAPFAKILPDWQFSGFVVDVATVAALIVYALAGYLLLSLIPYPRAVVVTEVAPTNA